MDLMALKSTGRALRRRVYQPPYRGFGPLPMPAKQAALRHVFIPGATVVETGTYHGDATRFFAAQGFPVHTIEVSGTLARAVFAGLTRIGVECHLGDSARILPELLTRFAARNVHDVNFWLDGHWSGAETSTSPDHETPILAELVAIAALRPKFSNIVVAVGDFRYFGNDPSYPEKDFLIRWAANNRLNAYFLADIFVASTGSYTDL